MKKIIGIAFSVIFCLSVNSQNLEKCITTRLVNYEKLLNPEYQINRNQIINNNSVWKKQNHKENKDLAIKIPIVIHIIYKQNHPNIGYGTNIPTEQIEDAIRILNEDYSKTNPEFPNPPRNAFLNISGNPNFEFCLATIDPDGNPTNGVTRTLASNGTGTFDADDNTDANAMKLDQSGGKDGWDPSKYLNIWICDLINSQSGGMTLGYAYLPGLPFWSAWKDGLVVDYRYFGTTGMAAPSSDGRTATHEIGHYLGLQHTFCESSSGGCCDNDDSNVYDTPATDGIYWGSVNAFTSNNTCNDILYGFSSDLLDMDENYMSYSRDTWMFSEDQATEMNATLNGYRSSLRNSVSNGTTVNCTGTVPSNIQEHLKNLNIKVYPNPTKNYLNISGDFNLIERICIYNFLGVKVYERTTNLSNTINVSSFISGIYSIKIEADDQVLTKKIVIK